MADPTPYTVSYSFSGFQANNPTTPLPGQKLDNELANAAASIAALISSVKDVRRSDGALNTGIVTFDSLSSALKLTVDPTNGQQVAAAVSGAQTSATNAANSATAANTSATNAATSASNAAASAAGVNLSLYLPKAGNLAGIGSASTARSNILAANVDGSDIGGRLSSGPGYTVTDWNTVVTNGWFAGNNALNSPSTASTAWLAQVLAYGPLYVTQIAYPFVLANGGVTSAVTPFRRHAYDTSGTGVGPVAWTPWESYGNVPVGSTIWVNSTAAPNGFVKENGALLSRATYPALWAFANASGFLVSEAAWFANNSGAFSTGDLSTTFRVPDARGEFIRAFDNGRGVDTGRGAGSNQAADNAPHTHAVTGGTIGGTGSGAAASGSGTSLPVTPTNISISTQGVEGRPRNIPKLACIKF